MRITLLLVGLLCVAASGCTVVSYDRVFPKLAWYWSYEAKQQRADNKQHDAEVKAYKESIAATNGVSK